MSVYKKALAILDNQKRNSLPRRVMDKLIINLLLASATINIIVLCNVIP